MQKATWRNARCGLLALLLLMASSSTASAVSIWNLDTSDVWSNAARWTGGIPDGVDVVADLSQINITGTRTVTLDSSRTVGTIIFGDASTSSHNWILTPSGSETLTLATSAGTPTIQIVNQQGRINAAILGNQGFVKTGAGELYLVPNGPTLVGGIDVQQGRVRVDNASTNSFGNNRLNVASGATVQVSPATAARTIYSREITGNGTLETAVTGANFTTLRPFVLREGTFSGSASLPGGPTSGGYQLALGGISSWTLDGAFAGAIKGSAGNSIVTSGELVIAGAAALSNAGLSRLDIGRFGTITLDNSASNLDRINDGTDVFVFGGTLRYLGNGAAASSETIDRFGSRIGTSSSLQIDRNGQDVTLTFNTTYINDNAYKGVVNFVTNGTLGGNVKIFGSGASHGFEGTAMRRVFVNGVDFAKYDAVNGFIAFAPGDYLTPASINAAPGSNSVVLMNNSMPTKSLSANKSLGALKLDGDAVYTLDLAGNTLTLGGNNEQATFQLLKTGNETVTISNGLLSTGGTSTVDLIVRVSDGALVINSNINLSGSNRFVKSGEGLLVLGGSFANATVADAIYFSEGTVRMNPLAAGLSGPQRIFTGGVMEITGISSYTPAFGTGANEVSLVGGGGFAAFGGDVAITTPLTWAGTNQVADSVPLLLNSTTADSAITLSGTFDLAGADTALNFREIRVADNVDSDTDKAVISGQIIGATNQSHFLKTGDGLLELTHANSTYQGETIIRAGRLNMNGQLSVVTGNSHGTVTVMDGATLGGTGAILRPVVAEAGSIVAPGASAGSLEIGSTFDLQVDALLDIELGGTSFTLNGVEQYDRLKVIGETTLAGELNVTLIDGFQLGASQVFGILDAVGGLLGLFAGLSEGDIVLSDNGFDLIITYQGLISDAGAPLIAGGNDVVLYTIANDMVVPEPATWTLLLVGMIGMALSRKRRVALSL